MAAATGPAARNETAKLIDADGAANDAFGSGAAISGATVLGASPADQVGTHSNQGSATIFFDPLPVADVTPPETSAIKGKQRVKRGKRAKYRFSSSEAGSTFECRLDRKPFTSCSSPLTVKTKKLKGRRHAVEVRAIDAAGNVDQTPARKRFTVVAG